VPDADDGEVHRDDAAVEEGEAEDVGGVDERVGEPRGAQRGDRRGGLQRGERLARLHQSRSG